jgi:histidine ammonia-lyase
MAANAARRLAEMAFNSGTIVAIELLAAAQGIDLRQPLSTSPPLQTALAAVRGRAAFLDQDRAMAPDIAAVHGLIAEGWFSRAVAKTQGIGTDAAGSLLALADGGTST